MESQFGFDYTDVRVHTDGAATSSASDVGGRAYTVGSHIVFGSGQYAPATPEGRRLLAHELTHVMQQARGSQRGAPTGKVLIVDDPGLELEASRGIPRGVATSPVPGTAILQRDSQATMRRQTCEAVPTADRYARDECSYRAPENCPTYEQWVATFTQLRTFGARASPTPSTTGPNVFTVIGAEAAEREPTPATRVERRPSPTVRRRRLGEQFIDHPTDTWVNECLPANLRATAYQLPSDCADIAVILRHVWLASHLRTERFGQWTIGDRAGEAAQSRIGDVIASVYSGNVAMMVNAYSDSEGNPIRSIAELEPLLHPGDILVWSHFDNGFDRPRTGGHTLTISAIDRDHSGRIMRIRSLQGNEPIFEAEKTEIIARLRLRDTHGVRGEMGHAPGRRIETNALLRSAGDLADETLPARSARQQPQRVWRWGATTLLVAAGPARAAARPSIQRGRRFRQLSDWIPSFEAAARRDDLVGSWEAMLGEARATIEGGGSLSEAEAERVGAAAGQALWRLARREGDLANESHFRRIQELEAMVWAIRTSHDSGAAGARDPIALRLSRQLEPLVRAFADAARGGADISFDRNVPRGTAAVNVLITGFDPFVTAGASGRPQPGDWNPSGAAVLSLDGARIPLEHRAVAAVEGVVLPVDFVAFGFEMVERIARPHADEVDAVLTVSVDPGMTRVAGKRPSPVRIERFAVGVREPRGGLAPIPLAVGGTLGDPIVESSAPIDEIAAAAEQPATLRAPGVDRPTIGDAIRLRFDTPTQARAALAALQRGASLPVGKVDDGNELLLGDLGALRQVVATLRRESGPFIAFVASGRCFRCAVVAGPGGNFLSNEVSFRMLRLLGDMPSPRRAFSFHTHTEPGNVIPSDTSTRQAREARAQELLTARAIKERLIRTLRRMIEVVGGIVLRRRRARSTGGGG